MVGLLSGSHTSVSGPAAGLTAVVTRPTGGARIALRLSNWPLVVAGILQLRLAFARAGSLGNVLFLQCRQGLLAAIGVILILKQIPHLVGFDDVDPSPRNLAFQQTEHARNTPVRAPSTCLAICMEARPSSGSSPWRSWWDGINPIGSRLQNVPAPSLLFSEDRRQSDSWAIRPPSGGWRGRTC